MKHESAREAIQAAPPITVGGFTLFGFPLNDIVLLVTLIYTILLVFSKSPAAYEAVIFWHKKLREKYGKERSK